MRIKICGITRVEDGLAVAEAGGDTLGLNFVGGPRLITPEQADPILAAVSTRVTPMALVRIGPGQPSASMRDWLADRGVTHLQLYGEMSEANLAPLLARGFRLFPAVAMRSETTLAELPGQFGSAWGQLGGIVLDAYHPQKEGGTGQRFRWDWLENRSFGKGSTKFPKIILAGGLDPDNVADAINLARPDGVDVSSGVEITGQPGRKDHRKVDRFIRRAAEAFKTLAGVDL